MLKNLIFTCFLYSITVVAQNDYVDSVFTEGRRYKESGMYKKALQHYQFSLNHYTIHNSSSKIIDTYNAIGLLYFDLKNFELSQRYFNLALSNAYKEQDSMRIAYGSNNLGMYFQNVHQLDSALHYYHISLDYKYKLNDSIGISRTLTNLGTVEIENHHLDTAITYFNKSLKIKFKLSDSLGIATVYNNLGNTYGYKGYFDSTEYYLEKGLPIAERNKYLFLLSDYYRNFIELSKERNQLGKIIHYQNKFISLQDSLFTNELANQLANQQNKFELNLKDKALEIELHKNELLKKENELSANHKQYLINVSIVLIILIVLLVYLLKLRAKTIQQNKKNFEKQKTIDDLLIEKEKNANQLIKAEKDQLIRELTVFTLQKTKYKETVKYLLEELVTSKKDGSDKIDDLKKGLTRLIKENDDWEDFKIQFEKIHPSFFNGIKSEFLSLSQNDLRHIAYIKLGMNTKEIAQLLNINPSSVQKSRVRLKQKMGLDKSVDLISYIKNYN